MQPAVQSVAATSWGAVVATALSWICAAILTAATGYLVYDLPFARPWVAAALIACFVWQLRAPDAWLLYLPALLPVFDLTLWSGRLYITEFDLLILTTAAAHFWRAPPGHQFPNLRNRGGIIIGLLILSYTISLVIGALPLPSPDANELGSYYSHYNALRVAKAFVWALLLLAPLQWRLSRDAVKTGSLFVIGTSIGLILVGVVVLWERSVLLEIARSHNLYADRYAILGALLDFTNLYRATALFSELHTGGEAIDTYFSLASPIAAAGVLMLRRPVLRLVCLAGLSLGTYAVAATFSRGLYLAFGSAIITVLVVSIIAAGRSVLPGRFAAIRTIAAIILAIGVYVIAFDHGGFTGLLYAVMFGGAALAVAHFIGRRSPGWTVVALAVLASCGTYAIWHAFAFSRYNTDDAETLRLWAGACGAALVVAAALLGGRIIPRESRAFAAIAFVCLGFVSGIGIPATVGYLMRERFSTAAEDSQTRREHWEEALQLMGPDRKDYLLGLGLGSFPRVYFLRGEGPEPKASYFYRRDATRAWLTLGPGDFNLTQKIPIKPATGYALSLLIRATVPGSGLVVKICPKLILFSDRYTPDCKEFDLRLGETGKWIPFHYAFDSGKLGQDSVFYWPTTLMLSYGGDSTIDITDITLSSGEGNVVANGDFASGGDRWILISDFAHLAWHVKDLYVAVFFDSGAVGLAIFVVALLAAFWNAARTVRQRGAIGVGLVGALVGFVVIGFVGSLLDNPRPASLFFLVLFWALQPVYTSVAIRARNAASMKK